MLYAAWVMHHLKARPLTGVIGYVTSLINRAIICNAPVKLMVMLGPY